MRGGVPARSDLRACSRSSMQLADNVTVATRSILTGCVLVFCMLSAAQESADEEMLLGSIDFPTSGSPEAQAPFRLGVLALHSFWYEQARDYFLKAQALDPDFGMAWWGEAMSYDNAFLTESDQAGYERQGENVVARMDELDAAGQLVWDERERGFAEAVRRRFAPGYGVVERRQGHAQAMERLSLRYPDDDEITVFTALALMALPGFDREQPLHVVTVAGRLEEVYERNREHPGALHYLIHAYDTQTFAAMGLRQARVYAKIAPASSHALHMPSHIFRHLGMWPEVAASNEESYRASVAWQERTGRPLHMRDYHALDWLLDACLRTGRIDQAQRIMEELDEIEAEILRRGEEFGHFASAAETLRAYYASALSNR